MANGIYPASRSALLGFALLLAACVAQTSGTSRPPTDSAACERRLTVARHLAELHQYGGNLDGHISELARSGASQAELAEYRQMARKIASVPTLAGDGGRQMGVEMALSELDLKCSA